MDQEKIAQIFTDIGEGEGDKALIAAKELINGSNDNDLRQDISKIFTRLLQAKGSVEQEKIQQEYIQYVKTQMALIYVQAFRGGRSHQMMLQNEQTEKLMQMASRMQEEKDVNPQEFMLPKGAPLKMINEDETQTNVSYRGTTEDGSKVIILLEGETVAIEVEWEKISVDQKEVLEFMQQQEIVPGEES